MACRRTLRRRQSCRNGRVLTETFNGRVLVNHYDVTGRRVRRVTSSGTAADYGHDVLGRLTSVRVAGHALAIDRDPLGRTLTHRLDARTVLAQVWDVAGRLAAQDFAGQRRKLRWRPDGQLVSDGRKQVELDVMGRVTAIHSRENTERYGYDLAGNVTAAAWLPGGDGRGELALVGSRRGLVDRQCER